MHSKIERVTVKITYRGETYEAREERSVKEALISIGLAPQLHLAVRDGRRVTEDQKLKPDDRGIVLEMFDPGWQYDVVVNFPTIKYDHADPDNYWLPLDTHQFPY